MEFGLWIEPEMVSEDSDLYRAPPGLGPQPARPSLHPRGRSQLVLDYTRPEVREYIFQTLRKRYWIPPTCPI